MDFFALLVTCAFMDIGCDGSLQRKVAEPTTELVLLLTKAREIYEFTEVCPLYFLQRSIFG